MAVVAGDKAKEQQKMTSGENEKEKKNSAVKEQHMNNFRLAVR